MRNIIKKNVFIIALFILTLLTGCNINKNEIKSISIDQTSLKDSYKLGEFKISNLKLSITYTNKTEKEINIALDMISEDDLAKLNTEGEHNIEVIYQGFKTSFTVVLVEELGIEDLINASQVNISFRTFSYSVQSSINKMIDTFNDQYPNVNITIEYIGSSSVVKDRTLLDFNDGNAPTIVIGYPEHFAEYINNNAIISLESFINSSDPLIGYSQDEINDYFPDFLNEVRIYDNDKTIMGLPFTRSTEIMYYNKDFFDYYNLEVPKTWEEFEILNEVIKLKRNNPSGNEFLPLMYDSESNLFTTIIHQFGGEYTKPVIDQNGLINLLEGELSFVNDSKAIEAFTYLQELANSKAFNVPSVFDNMYGSGFLNDGKIIMNISSSASSAHYLDAKCNVGIAPILYHKNKNVVQQGTNVAIMSQASKLEKLAAWLFIKHCLNPENTAQLAIDNGFIPVRKSALTLPLYQQFLNNPTPIQKMKSEISKVIINNYFNDWNFIVDVAWKDTNILRSLLFSTVSAILIDNEDVQKTFTNTKNQYNSYYWK